MIRVELNDYGYQQDLLNCRDRLHLLFLLLYIILQEINTVLKDHMQNNLDLILSKQPNALVIITGDFNPTTTGLKCKDIAQVNHLSQLKFKTKDSGILDWFCTNRPKLFDFSQ